MVLRIVKATSEGDMQRLVKYLYLALITNYNMIVNNIKTIVKNYDHIPIVTVQNNICYPENGQSGYKLGQAVQFYLSTGKVMNIKFLRSSA